MGKSQVRRDKSFVLPDFVGSAVRVVVGPGLTEYGRLGAPHSPGIGGSALPDSGGLAVRVVVSPRLTD